MSDVKLARVGFWILTALLFISLAVEAQQLTPEGQKFLEDFMKAHELKDDSALKRLIIRNKEEALKVYEYVIQNLCANGTQANIDMAQLVAERISDALRDERYTYRFNYILRLTPEQRNDLLKAHNEYYYGWLAYDEGLKNENPYKLDEALQKFLKAQADYEKLGDLEKTMELTMRIGQCHEALKDGYMACKFFKQYLDLSSQLPFSLVDHKWVQDRYNFYIGKGYDPAKPRDEGGEPPPEAEGGVEGGEGGGAEAEGKKLVQPEFKLGDRPENWEMKYGVMKSPEEFITPAFDTGFQPFLWSKMYFDSEGTETTRFVPYGPGWSSEPGNAYVCDFYGKQLNIIRVKNKFYLDVDGNEKTQSVIKASTKPSKMTIEDEDKDEENKPIRYNFFLQIPGSQEAMFGIEMNNATQNPAAISLRVRSGCYTKGKIQGENVVLIDDNSSGTFGDAYEVASDYITSGDLSFWRLDAIQVGREKKARPFSRYLKIEDKYYYFNVDRYGRKVTTTEASVETGTIRLVFNGEREPTYLVLHLLSEANPGVFFDIAGSKDPVEVPIGEYEIACGKIEESKKGQARQIRIYHGKADYIRVYAGEETLLDLGAPFKFTFDTTISGTNYVVKGQSLNVWGKANEVYAVFFDYVPQPKCSIRDKATGKFLVKGEKMRMAERDDFFEDPPCVWFPMDFIYENKKGGELEAMLEVKEVKLLGGPIASDWK